MSDQVQTKYTQNLWKYFSNHPEKYTVVMMNKVSGEFMPFSYSQKTKEYDTETNRRLFRNTEVALLVKAK